MSTRRSVSRIAKELLELEYPQPGSELRHPTITGRALWSELRQALIRDRELHPDDEGEPVPEYFGYGGS